MSKPRKILHLDLDAFFCAVEELLNPELAGIPFAVGGKPDQRGVVASCSYPARKYGIHSAMPMSQAVRRYPDLIIIPQNFKAYGEYSRKVMAILRDMTPLVEQISIDEAFLDVTMRHESAESIAHQLQATIATELQLPCSIGVATNKLVAKIANNIGKSEAQQTNDGTPNAITIVAAGEESAFLSPLSVRELWGVGPRMAEQLRMLGIHTIDDIARWPADDLERRFGKNGADIAQRARGVDERPVETDHEAKSISKEVTFTRDVHEEDALRRTLRTLSDGVGRQVRKSDLTGTTIKLKMRWSDFTTISRQMTLPNPTNLDKVIFDAAYQLFKEAWPKGKAVRLLGVGMSGFVEPVYQLGLWDKPVEQEHDARLQDTLDTLRDRFGESAIRRGSGIRRRKSSDSGL